MGKIEGSGGRRWEERREVVVGKYNQRKKLIKREKLYCKSSASF